MTLLKDISEIFYYIAGGLGLLFAGIGGLKWLIADFIPKNRKNNEIKRHIKELKTKYPLENFPDKFYFVYDPTFKKPKHKVMLLDKVEMTRNWIRSPYTLYTLEFKYRDIDKDYDDKDDYNSYTDGDALYIEEFEK